MSRYYEIKLNVPRDKESAIRALIPDGAPVSSTLVGVLLDAARDRSIPIEETPAQAAGRLEKRLGRVEQSVRDVNARLDAAIGSVLKARGSR